MKRALVVLGLLVLATLLAADIYLRMVAPQPAAPAKTETPAAATAPPAETTVAAATAAPVVVEEEVAVATPVAVADAGAAGSSSAAAPPPAKGKGSTGGRKGSRGITGAAPSGGVAAPPVAPGISRAFVPSGTDIEGPSGPYPKMVPGFDPGGVDVAKAPKVAAAVEFDVQPARVGPGDPYQVKVYLRNQGKKSIRIKELRVGSSLNGVRSEAQVTPRIKEVPPQQVALIAEAPSVWKKDVTAWALDVTVKSGHGEVYKNSVVWK